MEKGCKFISVWKNENNYGERKINFYGKVGC